MYLTSTLPGLARGGGLDRFPEVDSPLDLLEPEGQVRVLTPSVVQLGVRRNLGEPRSLAHCSHAAVSRRPIPIPRASGSTYQLSMYGVGPEHPSA